MSEISKFSRLAAAIAAATLLTACPSPVATTAKAPPPWPAPADADARIRAAGLEPLAAEGTAYHIHAHLRVFYDGQAVEVPANVGIDMVGRRISALHTHRASGVLHVEAPAAQLVTLGQFFTEWDVPLAGAKAYVNGVAVADAAAVVLEDKQVIVVVFGTPPAEIPGTYEGEWS